MHYLLTLENFEIYIKTYIKISPTCFGPRPSSGSLHLSLAKVVWCGSMLPHHRIIHNDVILPIVLYEV
jgi:hypothetical protein